MYRCVAKQLVSSAIMGPIFSGINLLKMSFYQQALIKGIKAVVREAVDAPDRGPPREPSTLLRRVLDRTLLRAFRWKLGLPCCSLSPQEARALDLASRITDVFRGDILQPRVRLFDSVGAISHDRSAQIIESLLLELFFSATPQVPVTARWLTCAQSLVWFCLAFFLHGLVAKAWSIGLGGLADQYNAQAAADPGAEDPGRLTNRRRLNKSRQWVQEPTAGVHTLKLLMVTEPSDAFMGVLLRKPRGHYFERKRRRMSTPSGPGLLHVVGPDSDAEDDGAFGADVEIMPKLRSIMSNRLLMVRRSLKAWFVMLHADSAEFALLRECCPPEHWPALHVDMMTSILTFAGDFFFRFVCYCHRWPHKLMNLTLPEVPEDVKCEVAQEWEELPDCDLPSSLAGLRRRFPSATAIRSPECIDMLTDLGDRILARALDIALIAVGPTLARFKTRSIAESSTPIIAFVCLGTPIHCFRAPAAPVSAKGDRGNNSSSKGAQGACGQGHRTAAMFCSHS